MHVTLERWGADDIAVLERANTAEMTRFLGGGVEIDDKLADRHAEYLDLWESGSVRMFRVEADGTPAGYAGWWEEEHDGMPVYEVGCVVEPRWQGHGVASAALTEVVRLAAATPAPLPIIAYTHVENEAAGALCRRVGFALVGTGMFPFAEGEAPMSVNVWMIEAAG
jgi:RimJ/RimL family protein N-acetyltransferase